MADDTVTATIVATAEEPVVTGTVTGSVTATVEDAPITATIVPESPPAPVRFDDLEGEAIDVSGDGGVLKKIVTAAATDAKGPPEEGAPVTAHYTGTLTATGAKFDSSRDRGQPMTFQAGMGKVIKGWEVGAATMKVGERAVLRLRADYAYGPKGHGNVIPPNASLDFDLVVLAIGDKPVPPLTHWLGKLAEAKKAHGAETPHNDTATALANLGTIFYRKGEFKQSKSLLTQALAMREKLAGEGGVSTEVAATLGLLGRVHTTMGDNDVAMDLHKRALAMLQALHGTDTPNLEMAVQLATLGRQHQLMKDLPEARRALEASLRMMHDLGRPSNSLPPPAATTYGFLGHQCMREAKYTQAKMFFRDAALLKYRLYGRASPEVADYLNHAGLASVHEGDLKGGIKFFEEAVRVQTAMVGNNAQHPSVVNYANRIKEVKHLMTLPRYQAKMRKFAKTRKDQSPAALAMSAMGKEQLRSREAFADAKMAELLAAEEAAEEAKAAGSAAGSAAGVVGGGGGGKKKSKKSKKKKKK